MKPANDFKDALFSPCGFYRYRLIRRWEISKPSVLFIMLNPSGADAIKDDPTIRRCLGFARSWGFGSMEVMNLFALISSRPEELLKCPDPFGPDNRALLEISAKSADFVVCAWGNEIILRKFGISSGKELLPQEMLMKPLKVIKLSAKGIPCHPLYLRKTEELKDWPSIISG